jgi:VWFA-related protein
MILPRGTWMLLLALPAFSQQGAPAARSGSDHRIMLNVVVTAKNGTPVAGLQQQDFTLLDNKQPSNILSFQAVEGTSATADPPVEVVLMVDRVNIDFVRGATERPQIDKFLRQNGGQLPYPVSMAYFADSDTKIQNPSRDGKALADAFDQSDSALRTVTRSQGVYGAIDRFQMSINALNSVAAYEAKKPGRKILIWLSPGWPMLSGPHTQLTKKNEEGLFAEIVRASTALREANITLYSVDPLGVSDAGSLNITWYRDFLKGVAAPKQVQAGNLALQVFAVQTGGEALNSSNDIGSQITACLSDLSAYYVIGFDAPAADGPNEYHALQVKMDKPGLTARTRTGYYAQP